MSNRSRSVFVGVVSLALLIGGATLGQPLLLILAAMAAALGLVLVMEASWRAWLALAFFVLVAAWTVYGQLDGLLTGMHRFGHAASSLGSIGGRAGEPKVAFDAVRGWAQWYSQPGIARLYTSPRVVAYLALAVDLFIIAGAAAALLILLGRGRRYLRLVPEGNRIAGHHGAYERIAGIGILAVWIGVGADLLEDAGYLGAVRAFWEAPTADSAGWGIRLLVGANWVFTMLKMVGFGTAILSLLLVGLGLRGRPPREEAGQLWRIVKTLRAQIVLTLLFGAVLMLHPQAPDVIRRWNTRQGVVAVLLAMVLVLIGWAFAKRLTTRPSFDRLIPRVHVLARIGGALLVVVVLLAILRMPAWGLAVPALFWLAVAGLDTLFGGPAAVGLDSPGYGRLVMPRLVAVAAMAILGVAVLRAAVGSYVLLGSRSPEGPLVAWGAGMLLASWGLYLILSWIDGLKAGAVASVSWRFIAIMAGALAIGTLVWVRIGLNVWATAGQLGAVGILEVFFIMATIVLGGLTMLAEWVAPPKTFLVLGFRRFPVFTLLVGWAVISSTLPVSLGYHDVRFLTADAGRSRVLDVAETPQTVLARFLGQLPPGSFDRAPDGSRRGIPVVFVAAAGGGIRAGYWAALVMDCLFQAHPVSPTCAQLGTGEDRNRLLFAGSGISGGSLGLMTFAAHQIGGPDPTDGENWVAARLGGDYLSAELAWELAVELPRALFRFSPSMDRAEVSERAWQQSWAAGPWTPSWAHAAWSRSAREDRGPMTDGFFSLWERTGEPTGGGDAGPTMPLLLLNGTSVTDGCRFSTSPLDGNGGDHGHPPGTAPIARCLAGDPPPGEQPPDPVLAATQDLEDFLCRVGDDRRVDVRLSTAAMLSARFPFVSPSGRIQYCGAPRQATYVVDGGYLDSSGADSIEQLWNAMEPLVAEYNAGRSGGAGDPATTCLVPFLIQLDNGYAESTPQAPTRRPGELTVPLTGLFAARSAFTALARQSAANEFRQKDVPAGIFKTDRYAHFYPKAHPGVEAPLGWVLSNAAQQDLLAQLGENTDQIAKVGEWLTQDLPCS